MGASLEQQNKAVSRTATLDFETRSKADLKKTGAFRYAQDPTTSILCFAYKFSDEKEVKLWTPGRPLPKDLSDHVTAGGIVSSHNAEFEFSIWNYVGRRLGWPKLSWDQLRCSAARAAALALPRSLEQLALAVNADVEKDMEGKRLMMKLSRPRKIKGELHFVEGTNEERERLYSYCKKDVLAEIACEEKTLPLSADEQKLWVLTEKINERGMRFDRKTVETAINFVKFYTNELQEELEGLTWGQVKTGKQTAKIIECLLSEGVEVSDLTAGTVKETLKRDDLTPTARRLLEIRQALAMSSVSKLQAMLTVGGNDDRLRGTILYHGASTGRFSGRGVQVQNFPRGNISDVENIFEAYDQGYDFFKMLFPNVLAAISSSLRGMLIASEGHELFAGDFASIEARGLLWLACDEEGLGIFRRNEDMYKVMAGEIYKVDWKKVNKSQRQVGKFACIAKGQLVLTDSGLIPIENISLNHKLWDGVEWVSHDGVILKGEKEVIDYEGLKATKDHIVWTNEGRQVSFGECASEGLALATTGFNGEAIRFSGDNIPGSNKGRKTTKVKSSLYFMLRNKINKLSQFIIREVERMPEMFSTFTSPERAFETGGRYAPKMHEFEPQKMGGLRRAGDRISLPNGFGMRFMGSRKSWIEKTFRIRQVEQYGPLRTRDFKICDESATNGKPSDYETNQRTNNLGGKRKPFFGIYNAKFDAKRFNEKRNIRPRGISSIKEAEELERNKNENRKVKVYDILNAGPRNRFTVSGKLVHNCLALGYGMGPEKFVDTCLSFGVVITFEFAQRVVNIYREKFETVKKFWFEVNAAAIKAVKNPGSVVKCKRLAFLYKGNFLMIKLPNGRKLFYASPKISTEMKTWGEVQSLSFMAVNAKTKKWEREHTYGGRLVENITQAVSRDLMVEAMYVLEDAGYKVLITVHDEVVTEKEIGKGTVEEFERLMSIVPAWAEGFPIAAEAYKANRYKK